MDLIDVRDREHAQRMDSLEMGNEGRISRIETAVESLLQRAAEEQHDETNSRKHKTPFHTRSVKLEFPNSTVHTQLSGSSKLSSFSSTTTLQMPIV
jgi:hypothetical protein